MSIEELRIRPAREGHAIEVMAFAIEWHKPLDAKTLSDVIAVYDNSIEIKRLLPKKASVGGFRIQLVPAAVAQQHPPVAAEIDPDQGGFDLQEYSPAGVMTWSVAIRPNFISCNCGVYERWTATKRKALTLVQPFLSHIFGDPDRQPSVFGLQYQDAFFLEGKLCDFSLDQLLRQPNERLPNSVFSHPSFWHVHQGWFSFSPEKRRVLNQLNVDYSEISGSYSIRINGQHRALAVDVNGSPAPQSLSEFEASLDHLHEINKTLLADILNDRALRLIGLKR